MRMWATLSVYDDAYDDTAPAVDYVLGVPLELADRLLTIAQLYKDKLFVDAIAEAAALVTLLQEEKKCEST